MKGLASFVMRGPSQAVMVASILALLSLVLPLFGMLSAASVGLVTLRQGARSGLTISLLATLACGLFLVGYDWLTPTGIGSPLLTLGFLMLQWLPVLLLGLFLRSSRSLGLTVQLALGFGLLIILGQYLLLGSPAEYWQTQLQLLMEQFEKVGVLDQANNEALLRQMAGWMGGVLAAGVFLQLVFSLLLARWWQALLYNPGGFRIEFHQFRLHRLLGLIGLPGLVILLLPFQEIPEIVRYLVTLLFAILFLQGLAVVHGILGKAGASLPWLVGLYLLLIILLPQALMVLATVGLLDIWIDFRTRFERIRSPG
jgi:hypothetical protein